MSSVIQSLKSILSIICASICAVGGLIFPSGPEPVLPSEQITQQVCVMTFNVYVAGTGEKSPENRTERVLSVIESVSPDSFGLQEADPGWMQRISSALSQEYAFVGTDRNGDGSGEASPVFYRKDKFELLDSGTFWLSSTPNVPSRGWDAMYNRVCTYAVLRDKQTGFSYLHMNTHFDHIGVTARKKSVELILNRLAQFDLPAVVTGDFNEAEGSDAYETITQSLIDTKMQAQSTMDAGTYHGYASLDKTSRQKPIDFIFATKEGTDVQSYTVHNEKVNGMYPSDHHAVSCELTMTCEVASGQLLKIMSFNVLCSGDGERAVLHRAQAVAQVIRSVMPDSFGVQEATPQWMMLLRMLLPEYSSVGVGRDDGIALGEFSAVFYLRDKYRVTESDTFWLSETPDTPSFGWEAACRRICTWAVLENRESGDKYVHLNTHLDHVSRQARINGSKLVMEKANEFDLPAVITGDFNATKTSYTYKVMTSGRFADSRALLDKQLEYNCTFHAMTPEYRRNFDPIDFIFVSDGIEVLDYDSVTDIFDGLYSDHFAIWASLKIAR